MSSLLPVKKMLSVIWKPGPRHNRMPNSVRDCIQDDPPPKDFFCRTWLVVILALTLAYYIYHINNTEAKPFSFLSSNVQDIQVVKTVGTTTTCGLGCDLEKVSNKTNTSIADIQPLDVTGLTPWAVCKINVSKTDRLNINRQEPQLSMIRIGGYYKPLNCRSHHKIAIIVPYRDRERILTTFLLNIHPFLMNQNLEYRMFVIEQSGHEKFNKGRLLNVGFEQAYRFGTWHCLVFHDVDLLPLDERILYTCPAFPRRMSTTIIQFKHQQNYNKHFGGVTSMTPDHYKKVNGFSNLYWGWGGEDSDMHWRIRRVGLPVVGYDAQIAQYTMLPHPREKKNPRRLQLIHEGLQKSRYKTDGLSSLKYKIVSLKLRSLYTHIVVNINPNKELTE